MALIELNKISKTYYIGGKVPVHALKEVSLRVDAGEFVAIMGASGSGKSTLLAILGLLDKAGNGQYKLLGKDVTALSENEYARLRNKFFGFIFQMFNLLPRLNVVENAKLPFIYAGEESAEDKKKVISILDKIGLSERLHHRPNELSGGQQQRIAIARAIANNPLVILADEPTGNLDSKTASEIMGLLKEINSQGNTIIMVTHEMDIARNASRIITLKDGDIVTDEVIEKKVPRELPKFSPIKGKKSNILSFSRLIDYSFEAISSLMHNKLRSFLSIMGVMIGVAAVIAMLALGTGAKQSMQQTFASLGTNVLMVRTTRSSGGISLATGTVTRFNFADLESLKSIEYVDAVVPYVNGRVQAVYQNRNWNTQVVGTSRDYETVKNSVPESGRFFSAAEAATSSKVAVIGKAVATQLFNEETPVGKTIRLNRVSFLVAGVLPEKGVAGWQNLDDQIIIPIKTAMNRLLGNDYINYFEVMVAETDLMPQVEDNIKVVLIKNHRLTGDQVESIDIRNMAEMQKAAGEMINTLSLLLASIAGVSLLVGGIGIMNIMLVMIMERTHEIGLRKSLGAEKGDILVQFLVESVLICVVGGLLGIIIGSLISWSVSQFAGWNTLISINSIVLAFGFSVMVGVVFGLWPAWRASNLQPIEALRYE